MSEIREGLEFSNGEISDVNKNEQGEKIILAAKSLEGDADWYGDFNYYGNPLSHYSNSKMCTVTVPPGGSGHGYGDWALRVETTMEFIKMMGWEDDLKYRIK